MSNTVGIILIIVGALVVVAAVAAVSVGGVLLWQTWALVRVNRLVAEKLAEGCVALGKCVPMVDTLAKVAEEIKDFQDGEVKLMTQQIRAVRDLTTTVEEFETLLIKPERPTTPRRARQQNEVQVTSEGDELVREQRRKESAKLGDVELEDFGNNVAAV